MIEADRVLRPLQEAEPAIEQLDTYESPAVLTEALRATWHAADRTLRMLLRSDASAPDHIRLTAMSPEQTTAEAVVLELRRRDLISLGLAGRVHALRQALERAESGTVLAADADNARAVVRCLVQEVHGVARRQAGAAEPESAAHEPGSGMRDPGSGMRDPGSGMRESGSRMRESGSRTRESGSGMRDPVPVREGATNESAQRRSGRVWDGVNTRPIAVTVAAAILLIIAAAAVVLLSGESKLAQGITAFQEDRMAEAEQHFRASLQESPDENTARLYLARILRRDARYQEAAQLLRAASAQDGEDPAVRRELGYLFLDLNQPSSAAGQFRRAVELDAEDPLNWAGMVHALRVSGDSSAAEEWLRRAPDATRELVGR